MHAPKVTPRFLPTLTEVVKPLAPPPGEVAALSPETPVHNLLTEEALVAAVIERLLPDLESQLQRALQQSFQVQLERILPAVMIDLDVVVRAAIKTAVIKVQDANRS